MSAAISPISIPSSVELPSAQPAATSGGDFQNVLQSAIRQVEASRSNADSAVQGFIAGGDQELHSTILATQNAELQFAMFMQVRNKVVSAYEEIMRMQV
jgi:flagellar hook-basal body complex protein FliE